MPSIKPPSAETLSAWRAIAEAFLREELPAASQPTLSGEPTLRQSPLEGEGAIVIWPFEARLRAGQDAAEAHFVVVGQTTPNYYPAYGLTADDLFCLHLGTRFMLTVGVARVGEDQAAAIDALAAARSIVDRVAPGEEIRDVAVAAAFQAEGQLHVVIACSVGRVPVYIFAGDLVPGFSHRRELPAPVVYRLHIGRLLLAEDESESEGISGGI